MIQEGVDRRGLFHVLQVIKCPQKQVAVAAAEEEEELVGEDFVRREAGKQAR